MFMKLNVFVTLTLTSLTFLLSGCSATVPKEYVGIWSNQHVVLEVQNTGNVKYADSNHRLAFQLSEIDENEISGYLGILTSISIEGPPQKSEDGLITLIVEDQKLYKQSKVVIDEINSAPFYNSRAKSNKVESTEKRRRSLKEFGRSIGNDLVIHAVTTLYCRMRESCY